MAAGWFKTALLPSPPRAGGRSRRSRLRPAGDRPPAFTAATLVVIAALAAEIIASLRRGEVGLDIVALLSMTAALAIGETLAAAVVALMYAGGQSLEGFAERAPAATWCPPRPRPRSTRRYAAHGLEEIASRPWPSATACSSARARPFPSMGRWRAMSPWSTRRRSRASRSRPSAAMARRSSPRDQCRRAFRHAGGPRRRRQHTRRHRPPRGCGRGLEGADGAPRRPLRHGLPRRDGRARRRRICAHRRSRPGRGGAGRGNPLPAHPRRSVALVAGLSRAAARGILVKGGKALEALARIDVLVLDKTGTLTHGRPRITSELVFDGITPRELLRLAASADQRPSTCWRAVSSPRRRRAASRLPCRKPRRRRPAKASRRR